MQYAAMDTVKAQVQQLQDDVSAVISTMADIEAVAQASFEQEVPGL